MSARDAAQKILDEVMRVHGERLGMDTRDSLALAQVFATLAVADAVNETAEYIANAADHLLAERTTTE